MHQQASKHAHKQTYTHINKQASKQAGRQADTEHMRRIPAKTELDHAASRSMRPNT